MNRAEALKILGLESSATKEEIKKKFKKLAFEKHPDRNKSNPKAEEEFKKISAANDYLVNPPPEPQRRAHAGGGFRRTHNPFFITKPNPIRVNVRLTFKESVLGTKKKLKIERLSPCMPCQGQGGTMSDEKCPACNGTGYFDRSAVNGNQYVSIRTPCMNCSGIGCKVIQCDQCHGSGSEPEKVEIDVKIPGGVVNGHIIRLQGGGSISVQGNRMVQGDVYLAAKVERDPNMTIQNQDVISTIDLTLKEAVKGQKKTVTTVLGEKEITIKKGSRHKDQIKLSKHGVEKKGFHIFNLNVVYPKDLDGLSEFLNKEGDGI
jgi:molecular chaperone DnaJ